MSHLEVFRNLTGRDSRLAFHTKATKDKIPESPGCYAWFLPLWFYTDDLESLMNVVNGVLDYEPQLEKELDATFNWQLLKMKLRPATPIRIHDGMRSTWQQLLADDRKRDVLQKILLEASLLMPPLYVGRTRNLHKRYLQHTARLDTGTNDFHSRFSECADGLQLRLAVSDLLFVSIETEREQDPVFTDVEEDDVESLIEQILMQFCRPPFSLR